MKATPPGKVAGNNQPLWGATVLDFFRTRRIPDCENLSTISTGSKLCAWMKEIGELEHAKDEIAWAEDEADPEELFPCDMAALLRVDDLRTLSVQKLFDEKFKIDGDRLSSRRYLKYQNRLPLHLLPEKLIVHDPDDTLHVHTGSHRPAEDRSTLRTYKLHLTQETRDAITKERARVAAAAEGEPGKGRVYATASEEIITGKVKEGPVIEATFAVFPPIPPTLSTPEAHLYINSCDRLGEGNHSYVYRVAWEIPRSLVMEPYTCQACVEQALFKKLREEEPEAKIDETQPLDYQIEDLMVAIAAKHGRQGKMWIEERTRPSEELKIVDRVHGAENVVVIEGGRCDSRTFYEGTNRRVPIDVKWTTPGNFCEHEEMRNRAPTTFKVSVGAKLSIQNDSHLKREARNYQQFPEHFFQHWGGYNVIPPLHDPTPSLAIVPQFYGYYIPEEGEAKDEEYLSPILLLEDCGVPVDIDKLDLDDRHECASLLFRMHCEGWLHNSVYPRNILVQHGDMSDWPICRKQEDRRFRLIDFGRSQSFPPQDTSFGGMRSCEEWACQEMFKILNCRA
ncbi:hypothetical protein ARMGADRAFT_965768 [Armillaria gallica]|uniref:Protein kinase domain-containing protein n=1 Tax=Armillaria gallica TaxID=47427 RepID=A0A2H3DIX9_ARMGA|nr:hypothetical protein ARMGADRAFT_965768 [Armillaria gallica]